MTVSKKCSAIKPLMHGKKLRCFRDAGHSKASGHKAFIPSGAKLGSDVTVKSIAPTIITKIAVWYD